MFKDLISDLQGLNASSTELAKSQAGDGGDAVIQSAAETGGDANLQAGENAGAGDGDAGGEGSGDGASEEGDELSKSFEVTLENGQKFKALDATDLVKSLTEKMGTLESATGEALGLCVTMLKSLAADNAALHAEVAKLAKTGTGRSSLLAIVPQKDAPGAGGSTALVKSEAKPMSGQEFLTKSETAYNEKKITARELMLAESHINRGEAVPAAIIQKVMGS